MRAITVRQPWAWAIVHGGKDVENRTRNIAGRYRGPVAIHAGAALTVPPSRELGPTLAAYGKWLVKNGKPAAQQRGVILGVVDLTDVHEWVDDSVCQGLSDARGEAVCSMWAEAWDCYHLTIANPRPLATPVPAKGRLGLWTLPDDVEAAVVAQLGGVA